MLRNWFLTLRSIALVLLAGSVAAINGCDGWKTEDPADLPALRVVALREPLSRLRNGEGLEHDLLWHFSQDQKARLTWKWVRTPEEALRLLQSGKADMAAGRWAPERLVESRRFPTGPAYEDSRAVLVCKKTLVSSQDQPLLANLFRSVRRETPFIENTKLRILVHRRDLIPGLAEELLDVNSKWNLKESFGSTLVMARQLTDNSADCFVTDETNGRWIQSIRPNIQITRSFKSRFSRSFVFSPNRRDLEMAFTSWFQTNNRQGTIRRIRLRYFGFQNALSEMDRSRLLKDKVRHLPTLKHKFQTYAKEFNLPWELIAAVAYQESHWNQDARSHTGVKGIMQLTRETAMHLGVEDREDLEQSLWGGAKYLRALIDQQPSHLHQREKLALALAAYNVGSGHLKDAQKLAVANGRSPFCFWDLRFFLPMLSDPAVAADLQYGAARGEEPIQFTERVFGFYDLLSDRSDVP